MASQPSLIVELQASDRPWLKNKQIHKVDSTQGGMIPEIVH